MGGFQGMDVFYANAHKCVTVPGIGVSTVSWSSRKDAFVWLAVVF